jgi:hypothetical protein
MIAKAVKNERILFDLIDDEADWRASVNKDKSIINGDIKCLILASIYINQS